MTKRCRGCGDEKALDAFHLHPQGDQGRNPRCKECRETCSPGRKRERETGLRTCRTCGLEAPIQSFPSTPPSGHRRVCHSCLAAASKERQAAWSKTERGKQLLAERKVRYLATDLYKKTRLAYREQHNENARRYRYTLRGQEVVAKNHALRRGAMRGEIISRREVWRRDGRSCQLCHKPVALKAMHLDHVVPIAKGGEHTYSNVQATHRFCNQSKGAS